MTRYNQKTEASMCLYFSQLNEKDKRHYAATEAIKLGRGGQKYMIDLLGRYLKNKKKRLSIFVVLTSLKRKSNEF